MALKDAFREVKLQLPRKYNRVSKIRTKLREIRNLVQWKKFITEVRRNFPEKTAEVETFLNNCLEEMIKMHTGHRWRSLIGGYRDLVLFNSLHYVTVRQKQWEIRICPTISLKRRFGCVGRGRTRSYPYHCEVDQKFCTMEILFSVMGNLNNIFDYKKEFLPKKQQN